MDHAVVLPVSPMVCPRRTVATGALVESAWWLTRRRSEPPITRFVARHAATAHWFDTSAARRDLGYSPSVSVEEGLGRLAASLGTAP